MASRLFRGVVFKRLSAVETDASRSNQHEFNGSRPLIELFGREQPRRFQANFLRVSEDGSMQSETGLLTWYDARAKHPTRTEFRLYYYDNLITRKAKAGDTLIIGRKQNGSVFLLIASPTGENAAHIAWLFGIEIAPGAAFTALNLIDDERFSMTPDFGAIEPSGGWIADRDHVLASDDTNALDPIRQLQEMLGRANEELDLIADDWIADS